VEIQGITAPRVGVVISCWDCLPQEDQIASPEQYLRDNLPLFWQFLKARESEMDVRIFGLSSTSGDLGDSTFKDQFLRRPHEFGFVLSVGEDGVVTRSNDLAEPIRWALEG
jgi:hypothetical protein